MKIIRWAAVAVTALFVLMDLGAAADQDMDARVRVAAGVLAAAGLVAAVGLATDRTWGRVAVLVVGALNVAGGISALVTDESGGAIGIVVGGLAVVLAALSARPEHTPHPRLTSNQESA
jgi:hypothetical protein